MFASASTEILQFDENQSHLHFFPDWEVASDTSRRNGRKVVMMETIVFSQVAQLIEEQIEL